MESTRRAEVSKGNTGSVPARGKPKKSMRPHEETLTELQEFEFAVWEEQTNQGEAVTRARLSEIHIFDYGRVK